MRLYSRIGATAVADGGEHYEAGEDGGFDFPDEVGARLHSFAAAGVPMWEDGIEQQQRILTEELERRKDPATLLDAVEQIRKAAQAVIPAPVVMPPPPAVPPVLGPGPQAVTASASNFPARPSGGNS